MADVYISYSRRDTEFGDRLTAALQDSGKDVWTDAHGSRDAKDSPAALRSAVAGSDGFVYVVSPHTVASPLCQREVRQALELSKRIVPLSLQDVDPARIPEELRQRDAIPVAGTSFERGVALLLRALDTDVRFVKQHTRLQVKALEWSERKRDRSLLLRGAELTSAEQWLAAAPGKDPAPTALHQQYLLACRRAATRRQRRFAAGISAVAAIAVALLILALVSRDTAVSKRTDAHAQALAAQSQAQLATDPEIALILAGRAVATKATPETLFALRAALDASPLQRGLPPIPNPGSCGANGGLSAAYSPDDAQLAEGTCTGLLRFVDAHTGTQQKDVHVGSGVASIAYAPDGSTLAVATGGGVLLVDPKSGAIRTRLGEGEGASSLAFSRDGRQLAAGDRAGVTLWTLPDGAARTLTSNTSITGTMAFTRDGQQLIAGAADSSVYVYDVASGVEVNRISAPQQSDWAELVALSPDGNHVAIAYPVDAQRSTGRVSVYRVDTWQKQLDVTTRLGVQISALAYSPDGDRLAIGGQDGSAGVWSIATGQQLVGFVGATAAVTSMQFTRDGRSVLTASNDGMARVWRASGAERSYSTVPSAASFGQVAVYNGRVEVTPGSGGVVYSTPVDGGSVRTFQLDAGGATLSPDGHFVLAHAAPGSTTATPAAIWNMATGTMAHRFAPDVYLDAAFSRDNQRLLLHVPQGQGVGLTVLSPATHQTVALRLPNTGCGPPGPSVSFNRGDTLVAGAYSCGTAVVWDAATGKIVRTIHQGGPISSVDLSADGTRLLVSSLDARATIWDVPTGRPLRTFIGHTRGIVQALFSPDGTLVATSGLDDTVRLWDVATGALLRVLPVPVVQDPIGFSADSTLLLTVDGAVPPGTPAGVRVFDACSNCGNAAALLKQASQGITPNLTELERDVVGRN